MLAPPLVSVITPSFNAARFLEETIQSVLAQDYPYIEYIVMDGGSTDGSLDILRSYADRLTYFSAADEGAADAINNGFAKARGEILAWLGADDTYLPGAVGKAVATLNSNPDAAAVYGEGYWTDAQGQVLGSYPTEDFDPNMFARECCICQPACFFRRDAVEAVGMLNSALRSSFDYDLWIRLTKRYRFVHLPEYLASSRMHRENKTLGQRRTVFTESIALLGQHFDYVPVKWVYGYLCFLRDNRDQFFEPLGHSIPAYLMALPVGLRYNPAHPFKYMAEWIAAVNMSKLKMFMTPGERPDAEADCPTSGSVLMAPPVAMPCRICGNATRFAGTKRGKYESRDFQLFVCPTCHFAFVGNPWTEYSRIYSEEYYRGRGADPLIDYVSELEDPRRTIRKFEWQGIVKAVRSLQHLSADSRWLDYGCGNGGLVRYIREHSICDAVGYEDGWIADRARAAGIPVLGRQALDADPGKFDVVTAIEVLEHVEDPLNVLRHIRALMNPGGLFFFTTGNAEVYRGQLLSWNYFIPEIHISLFEPGTAARSLTEAGFEPFFHDFLPGFTEIIRFKALKGLRVTRSAWWQNWLPWQLVARLLNLRFRISAHPTARVASRGRQGDD